jgi:hypothetical protein
MKSAQVLDFLRIQLRGIVDELDAECGIKRNRG